MRTGGGRVPWSRPLVAFALSCFRTLCLPRWLCLAFVESRFNISKGNENADGSFQINSHYWCNDDRSHSENICHEDCQDVLSLNLLSAISCAKKDCLWSRGYEELGSMEVALCRPATLLLDDRMFLGMRQDTGLP
ncbi:lysozyme-like protein 6 [Canis aureus]|eukprot:XP_022278469.1 lysozyme-like protein 6 [Canis lupus familiaris]